MIHKLAQFLLLNSEGHKSDGTYEKMSLIYFLFTYSKTYAKEHYGSFAFEVLENVLMEELSVIGNHKGEANAKIAGIGWSLIKFIESGYFESDDLDDILSIIDSAVFPEVERLSRTEFKTSYISQLIGLGLYLKERIDLVKDHEAKLLEIKEFLLITLFEINTNIKCIPAEQIELYGLCKAFFNDGANHKIIAPCCIEGLNILSESSPLNDTKKIIGVYGVLWNKGELATILAFNVLFHKTIKADGRQKYDLLDSVEKYSNNTIRNLYLEPEKNTDNNIQKLIISGIYSIHQDRRVEKKSIHVYLLGFLLNSMKNE